MAVTDLTNTSWVLNAACGYIGSRVAGTKTYNIVTNIGTTFKQTFTEKSLFTSNNSLTFQIGSRTIASDSSYSALPSGATTRYSGVITITGGTDVANPEIVNWFLQNATQIDVIFDLSTLGLSTGTYAITVKAKEPDNHRESPASNSATYTVT